VSAPVPARTCVCVAVAVLTLARWRVQHLFEVRAVGILEQTLTVAGVEQLMQEVRVDGVSRSVDAVQ
jgi:hypothetical protein